MRGDLAPCGDDGNATTMNRTTAIAATLAGTLLIATIGAAYAAPGILTAAAHVLLWAWERVKGFTAALLAGCWPQLLITALITLFAVAASIVGAALGDRSGRRCAARGRRR